MYIFYLVSLIFTPFAFFTIRKIFPTNEPQQYTQLENQVLSKYHEFMTNYHKKYHNKLSQQNINQNQIISDEINQNQIIPP